MRLIPEYRAVVAFRGGTWYSTPFDGYGEARAVAIEMGNHIGHTTWLVEYRLRMVGLGPVVSHWRPADPARTRGRGAGP